MTLEERLQGEWLCSVGGETPETPIPVDIRGREIDFGGARGGLDFIGDEARLRLDGGRTLIINRHYDADIEDGVPLVIESERHRPRSGYMRRRAAVMPE